jgi:hypothetical protein
LVSIEYLFWCSEHGVIHHLYHHTNDY